MHSHIYKLEGPGQLHLMQEPLDSAPLATFQIQARTIYSVVSPGTEIAAWKGLPPLRPSKVYPRLMGYCNLAEVTQIGSEVASVKIGDLVLTHQSHRSHFRCSEDDILLRVNPGSSEPMVKKLSATYLYHLGYGALLAGKYFPGHDVGIIGIGTLGRATASLVKAVGGSPNLFTNQKELQKVLRTQGFENVFDKNTDEPQADLTINTSNEWSDHELAMRTTRFGGTVVCLGFPGRGVDRLEGNPLDSRFFYDKQLSIKHSGMVNGDGLDMNKTRFDLKSNVRYLSGLIRRGSLNPEELVTREFDASKLADAYEYLSSRGANVSTVLLDWRKFGEI